MKKNYKLVLGLVAGLAVGSIMIQPTTTEAKIKYETAKQAGQRFYKAETLAYKNKKKVTRVFYYKTKDYKDIYKFTSMLYKEAAKAQYGDQFINQHMTDGSTDIVYVKDSYKKVKKGIGCYKITINGKNGTFRREYRETEANRKLLADLTPLTKGKSQFDKAFITMSWLRGRAYYQCGRNQDTSKKALWKRKYHTDCDGLAGSYSYYAKAAGVKKVGMVSVNDEDGGHSWNYIVVNGRMYFVDFQGWDESFGRKGDLTGKEFVKKMYDPDYVMKRWSQLGSLYKWYKEVVDSNAEKRLNCKFFWENMPEKEIEASEKLYGKYTTYDKYIFSCDSWSQSCFEPVKVFCYRSSGDYTVKQIKKNCYWDGSNHKGKCPYPKAIY